MATKRLPVTTYSLAVLSPLGGDASLTGPAQREHLRLSRRETINLQQELKLDRGTDLIEGGHPCRLERGLPQPGCLQKRKGHLFRCFSASCGCGRACFLQSRKERKQGEPLPSAPRKKGRHSAPHPDPAAAGHFKKDTNDAQDHALEKQFWR